MGAAACSRGLHGLVRAVAAINFTFFLSTTFFCGRLGGAEQEEVWLIIHAKIVRRLKRTVLASEGIAGVVPFLSCIVNISQLIFHQRQFGVEPPAIVMQQRLLLLKPVTPVVAASIAVAMAVTWWSDTVNDTETSDRRQRKLRPIQAQIAKYHRSITFDSSSRHVVLNFLSLFSFENYELDLFNHVASRHSLVRGVQYAY